MTARARRRVAMGMVACAVLAGCSDDGPTTAGPQTSEGADSLSPPADLAAARDTPVEDPYYPNTSNPEVDSLHYGLDLDWDGRTLRGTTTITLRAAKDTSTLTLDLIPELSVQRVMLDGKTVQSRRTDMHLVVESGRVGKGSRHTVQVRYSGVPERVPSSTDRSDGAEGVGWATQDDGSVHTFQQPWGAYTWYPVNDHPSDEAYYDARITTRTPMRAVFNGRRTGEQRTGDKVTSTWDLGDPAASYVMTIAIGEYRPVEDRMSDGTLMTYWVRPEDDSALANLRPWGRRTHTWLIKQIGAFPYPTSGVVVVGGDSAMETQTMITMSDTVARAPAADGEPVLAHESAHQWFGDDVSPKNWKHLWLSEGWAMYWQGRFQEEHGLGSPWQRWANEDNDARRRAGPPGRYAKTNFADSNVYLGPALMLREIRIRLGTATFDRLVKQWVKDHAGRHVDRAAFTTWWSKESGADLKPLIDRWLDSPTTPRIS